MIAPSQFPPATWGAALLLAGLLQVRRRNEWHHDGADYR